MKPGDVVLLENVRFHPEEEKNDPAFAAQLAALGDVYVNDAFGTAHRAHASTEGVAKILPGVAGFLMEKEIKFLGGVFENPAKPFVAIIGGAKVSTKIAVLESLLPRVTTMIIGGGMSFTFTKTQGHTVGTSLVEADFLDTARVFLEKAQHGGRRGAPAGGSPGRDRVLGQGEGRARGRRGRPRRQDGNGHRSEDRGPVP